MGKISTPLILFFINGPVATPDEIEQGDNIPGARVQYRNAQMIHPEDPLEPCDGTFGAVPESYKDFPSAKEAVEKYSNALKEKKKASGDQEAPPAPAPGTAKKPFEARSDATEKAKK